MPCDGARQVRYPQASSCSEAASLARLGGRCAFGIAVPQCAPFVAPLLYTIPVQLLAYHTAVLKGTDVDQPRNLAKSVTVE